MKNKLSTVIKNYNGENPFVDYQARNYSDAKVCSEFYPTSTFWSLFNDQHEILIGSRGSGKTILLRMMRNSMLSTINNDNSRKILDDKKYISLYVPMHLEFVASITTSLLSEQQQVDLFQVVFNCLLAQAVISEISILFKEDTSEQGLLLSMRTAKQINEIWFGESEPSYDFKNISNKVNKVFYSIYEKTDDLSNVPVIFKKQICTPLLSIKDLISNSLNYDDPTWIICIDEAEFLTPPLLKCINSFFRSASNRVSLKVATLPFYHSTLETLIDGVSVSDGNDFNFRIIDMDYESDDFKQVTNRICFKRLSQSITLSYSDTILESFLGRIGNDDLVDYYRNEINNKATTEQIEANIIESFPPKRKKAAVCYENKRKTVYDKYAPIFFLREMYARSQKGNSKPGWYAGAKTVRRVAQGNPRLFIHLMNDLFTKAQKTSLTPKAQHEVIYNFSSSFCKSTKAIESKGPEIYNNLDRIAIKLQERTHQQYLVSASSSFILKYNSLDDFKNNEEWIKLAIAHSRLFVDDDVKKGDLTAETKMSLANTFSVAYWIPMRKNSPISIDCNEYLVDNKYIVTVPKTGSTSKKKKNMVNSAQISLFEDNCDD